MTAQEYLDEIFTGISEGNKHEAVEKLARMLKVAMAAITEMTCAQLSPGEYVCPDTANCQIRARAVKKLDRIAAGEKE